MKSQLGFTNKELALIQLYENHAVEIICSSTVYDDTALKLIVYKYTQ